MIINMNGAKAPETPSSVLQEKTVTPETLPTVIGPDEGYDGLSQVTVNPDAQLKAENIRSGKTIFGVTGAFGGGSTLTPEAEFCVNVALTNSGTNPANVAKGVLTQTPKPYLFYKRYIGPDGIDISDLGPVSEKLFQSAYQYYRDGDGVIHLGGDIVLPTGTNGKEMFWNAWLTDKPVGIGNCAGAFKQTFFFTDRLVITEDNLPSGIIDAAASFPFLQRVVLKDDHKDYSFASLTLELPANVTKISGYMSISGGSNAPIKLVMKATVPPTLDANAMSATSSGVASITVPKGSLEAYQTAKNWSRFADIMTEATQ